MHERNVDSTYSNKFTAVKGKNSTGRASQARPALTPEAQQNQMNRWLILALAGSSSFITTLDGSIVNIGLPLIAHTFHVGLSGSIEWVVIGYLVIIAALLLTFGRLADLVGRKSIFLTGLLIFVIGSVLSGSARVSTIVTLCGSGH